MYLFENPQKPIVHDGHCLVPVVRSAQAHFHHSREKPPVELLLPVSVIGDAALDQCLVGMLPVFKQMDSL